MAFDDFREAVAPFLTPHPLHQPVEEMRAGHGSTSPKARPGRQPSLLGLGAPINCGGGTGFAPSLRPDAQYRSLRTASPVERTRPRLVSLNPVGAGKPRVFRHVRQTVLAVRIPLPPPRFVAFRRLRFLRHSGPFYLSRKADIVFCRCRSLAAYTT